MHSNTISCELNVAACVLVAYTMQYGFFWRLWPQSYCTYIVMWGYMLSLLHDLIYTCIAGNGGNAYVFSTVFSMTHVHLFLIKKIQLEASTCSCLYVSEQCFEPTCPTFHRCLITATLNFGAKRKLGFMLSEDGLNEWNYSQEDWNVSEMLLCHRSSLSAALIGFGLPRWLRVRLNPRTRRSFVVLSSSSTPER